MLFNEEFAEGGGVSRTEDGEGNTTVGLVLLADWEGKLTQVWEEVHEDDVLDSNTSLLGDRRFGLGERRFEFGEKTLELGDDKL